MDDNHFKQTPKLHVLKMSAPNCVLGGFIMPSGGKTKEGKEKELKCNRKRKPLAC